MRQLKITQSITYRESQSIEKYLTEIGKVDLISAEEEAVLARRIKKGDQDAPEKTDAVTPQVFADRTQKAVRNNSQNQTPLFPTVVITKKNRNEVTRNTNEITRPRIVNKQ